MAEFYRAFPLEDIRVRSGGDGRTVEAYAAVWNQPAEIVDQDGHYLEQLSSTAFNRTIAHRGERPWPVLFNHGRTIYGTPSEIDSVPIGVSIEAPRVDSRGLLTVSRYHPGERTDQILAAINEGSIRSQSFSGKFVASDAKRPRGGFRASAAGDLTLVTRTEVAMREYGPATFEAYAGAEILGVRAQLASMLTPEQAAQILALITPEVDPSERADTSSQEPVEVEAALVEHAVRLTRSIGAMKALRILKEEL